jgi:hypothetical protein
VTMSVSAVLSLSVSSAITFSLSSFCISTSF